jgi:MFS transporter, DHA1 family, multidrug resistance protein
MTKTSNSDPPATASRHQAVVTVLLAQVAFSLVAMAICMPSMQDWAAIMGVEQSTVQLTFSGYVFSFAALQLVYGPVSDRHGRKSVLQVGLLLALAGSIGAALAPDMGTLIAARLLQGAGAAAALVLARATVQDLFQGSERTRVMAFVGMAMGFSPPAAMVVGGQLHVWLGWRANFVLVALLALLLLFAARRWLPDVRPAETLKGHWLPQMLSAYARLMREPVFLLNALLASVTTGAFYTFLGGTPVLLKGFGMGPELVGWFIMFISASYVVGNFMTSRLVRRLGEHRMLVLGNACSVSGLLLVIFLSWLGHHSPVAFGAPLILLGLGHGFTMPAALAGSVGVIPELAGAASAVAGLLQQMLGALAGYAVGLLVLVGPQGPFNLGLMMLAFTLGGVFSLALLSLPAFAHRAQSPGPTRVVSGNAARTEASQ